MRRGRSAGLAFRQTAQPTPLLKVTILETDAAAILAAIDEIQRSRGCGAYLYITRDLNA